MHVVQYKRHALDPKWLLQNNSVCMWKDDGYGHPLIPKGKPPALQIRPLWGHFLAKCYEDKKYYKEVQ